MSHASTKPCSQDSSWQRLHAAWRRCMFARDVCLAGRETASSRTCSTDGALRPRLSSSISRPTPLGAATAAHCRRGTARERLPKSCCGPVTRHLPLRHGFLLSACRTKTHTETRKHSNSPTHTETQKHQHTNAHTHTQTHTHQHQHQHPHPHPHQHPHRQQHQHRHRHRHRQRLKHHQHTMMCVPAQHGACQHKTTNGSHALCRSYPHLSVSLCFFTSSGCFPVRTWTHGTTCAFRGIQ